MQPDAGKDHAESPTDPIANITEGQHSYRTVSRILMPESLSLPKMIPGNTSEVNSYTRASACASRSARPSSPVSNDRPTHLGTWSVEWLEPVQLALLVSDRERCHRRRRLTKRIDVACRKAEAVNLKLEPQVGQTYHPRTKRFRKQRLF